MLLVRMIQILTPHPLKAYGGFRIGDFARPTAVRALIAAVAIDSEQDSQMPAGNHLQTPPRRHMELTISSLSWRYGVNSRRFIFLILRGGFYLAFSIAPED